MIKPELNLTIGRFDTLRVMTIPGSDVGYLQVNNSTLSTFNLKEGFVARVSRTNQQPNYIFPTSI